MVIWNLTVDETIWNSMEPVCLVAQQSLHACSHNQINSNQDYLYSAFHETIVAKQLYRKLRFYNRFIYCRNLIYLTYGKIWLILYILWGVGIISSQVFGHLGSFKGWIQTEACVIPRRNRETNRDIISVAVVPSKQKIFVQPKLKHNNVHLIRYNWSTRLWDALYEWLAKEMCL